MPSFKNTFSPFCSLYISYGTSKENLSKYQDMLSLVITSLFSLVNPLTPKSDKHLISPYNIPP